MGGVPGTPKTAWIHENRILEMREGGFSKIDEKVIFQKWVFLVGKMFPDPVGVFCGLPRVPSGHIGQNPIFPGIWGFTPYFPYRALKGPYLCAGL